ncbi:MAG: BREX system ATP-binding protein BrxD [Planctomycetota bacterium]|nr:MAG: BREX system ATP-binding protein BrxD [Planctomycetota bacterium]
MEVSNERRREIIAALRKGTVPQRGLDFLAVGLHAFEPVIATELADVAQGGSMFKAVRGDYGCGKTFFGRWVQEFAKKKGFAVAEVQISETETPLHRLETVYRRAMEQLSTTECFLGAFRSILDGWFYGLEEDVLAEGTIDPSDQKALSKRADELLEQRLAQITRATPQFAAALRAYRHAQRANDHATAEGLSGWLAGQPHVAAGIKREAGVKGDVDHYAALSFLRGLLLILKDSGYSGLVLVLDEIETLQRVRGDVREKGLNALRQLIDDIDSGRFPNLYLLTTGTPAFFDGPQGVRRLEPLAQRLHVDFQTDPRFDNPRAVQLRLTAFDHARLMEIGKKVRDLYASDCSSPDRIRRIATDDFINLLAQSITGKLGGKVGIAPRLFLKKLVSDVLDKIDQHEAFDPTKHYQLTLDNSEMTAVERESQKLDDIELEP